MSVKNSEKVVPPADGHKHGYFGTVQDDTPNEAYTVTGVTKPPSRADGEEPKPVRVSRPKHASS